MRTKTHVEKWPFSAIAGESSLVRNLLPGGTRGVGWGLFLIAVFAPAVVTVQAAVPDFCFLQVSDLHISPQPGEVLNEENAQTVETIERVCREAKLEQKLESPAITTPPPAFVFATGDLTEYGVIGKTWDNWERYWKPLSIPLFVVPGNHDNTWTSMTPIMRKLHGGDNYSFDKFGCHFIGLDSATIQEPLPTIEVRLLTFVRQDLKDISPNTPVFIFQHHPLSTTEYSKPIEQLRFLEAIRDRNVVLLAMGHGHGVSTERWNSLDSVMGGSTFGPNAGYNIISVADGVLRVVYRYNDPAKPMRKLLEKPIAPQKSVEVEILHPNAFAVVDSGSLSVAARMQGITARNISASIDGREDRRAELHANGESFAGSLTTNELLPGMHFVHVIAETDKGTFDRAVEFRYAPPQSKVHVAQIVLAAGMKAGPVAADGGCIVGTTSGEVVRIAFPADPGTPVTANVLYKTGAEILHPPALIDGTLYVSAAERGVFSLDLDGKLNWNRSVGAAVYGTPAVVGDAIYIGDLEGSVHAIDRKTGELKWSKHHATYSIEMPLAASQDSLYFGAWDGLVYAVSAADGALKWKAPGPAGQGGQHSRYYAPADSLMAAVGDRLFVTDRAYRLGSYSLDGKYLGQIATGAAAIASAEDGKSLYARPLGKGLIRYDADGKSLWSANVSAGHFATSPTEVGGKVYSCSNNGLLSVLDADKGKLLWQYQVTPQTRVIGRVTADASGNVFVAGMDGTVSRLRCE